MEMILMGLCVAVFGAGVAAAAFGAATRSETPSSAAQSNLPLLKSATAPRFFSDKVSVRPAISTQQVPIEILLLQIENHVRMEQAAAESFLAFPTQAQLHSKTKSPFVH